VGSLAVVVVAYGPTASLRGALDALEGRYPVIVVDNGSSAETAALCAAAGARYVDSGVNLGFTAAVNVALDAIDAPGTERGDVLLLNPDARITPDAVERLRALLHADGRAACAGPALYAPGTAVPARSRWPWHTPVGAWAEALGMARRRLDTSRYFLGGAVLLLRRQALDEVGRFDERFFLYGEDEDWQRRARALGWRPRYCPEVRAEHRGGGTEVDPRRLRLRLHASIERYVRKWYGRGGWAWYRAAWVVGFSLRALTARGGRRRAARLARLYALGPDRAARRAGVLPVDPPPPTR
jgi:GT2 family glycosyltransferase